MGAYPELTSQDFESLFRWAWYHDFGSTPEQTIEYWKYLQKEKAKEVTDFLGPTRECDLSTSHYEMDLEEMLTKFESRIRLQGKEHNLDARAIAGAIAWEYEENWFRGRWSDYLQYSSSGDGSMWIGQGLGWGSVHTEKVSELHPDMSEFDMQCSRMRADSAIELIATIMDQQCKDYYKETGGIWIRANPSVIAMLFNSSQNFLSKSAKARKLKNSDSSTKVTLVISQNKMAKWVHENLARFERFRTKPTAPSTFHIQPNVDLP